MRRHRNALDPLEKNTLKKSTFPKNESAAFIHLTISMIMKGQTQKLFIKKKKKKSQMHTRRVRQSHEMNSSEMDLFLCEL